jgi:hypothetical protein
VSAKKDPKLLFKWRAAIRDSARSSTERHVAFALSTYGDEDGRDIFPSAERLAHDTGLSIRAVSSSLKALRDCGWLAWVHGQHSNRYTLTVPDDFVPDPFVPHSAHGAQSEGPHSAHGAQSGDSHSAPGASHSAPGASHSAPGAAYLITTSSITSSSSSTNGNGHSAQTDEDDDLFDSVATCLARLRYERELHDGKITDPRKMVGWTKATRANILSDEADDLRALMKEHSEVTDAAKLCELYEPDAPTGWQGVNDPGRGCFDFCEEHDYCYIGDCLPAHQAKHRHVSSWNVIEDADGRRVWMGTNLLLTDEENAARDAYEAERDALLVADPPW